MSLACAEKDSEAVAGGREKERGRGGSKFKQLATGPILNHLTEGGLPRLGFEGRVRVYLIKKGNMEDFCAPRQKREILFGGSLVLWIKVSKNVYKMLKLVSGP